MFVCLSVCCLLITQPATAESLAEKAGVWVPTRDHICAVTFTQVLSSQASVSLAQRSGGLTMPTVRTLARLKEIMEVPGT